MYWVVLLTIIRCLLLAIRYRLALFTIRYRLALFTIRYRLASINVNLYILKVLHVWVREAPKCE